MLNYLTKIVYYRKNVYNNHLPPIFEFIDIFNDKKS